MIYTKCVYNDDLEFEWDESKNQSNIEKHGIDFTEIITIFLQPCVVKEITNHYETRWLCIARHKTSFATVIYTKRSNKLRIISIRKASKKERLAYYEKIIE